MKGVPRCILLDGSHQEQLFFGLYSHSDGRPRLLGIARSFAKALNKFAMVGNAPNVAEVMLPCVVQVTAVARSFGSSEERP